MTINKLFLLIAIITVFSTTGNALERRKPLPLKELQNPNSPSYVPIPYPQTDEEVITDLKYYFSRRINQSKRRIYSVGDFSANDKIMRGFVYGKDVLVGEIIRVKNQLAVWERNYTFLIRLKTSDNIWLADICMNSNGLFCGKIFLDIDVDKLKLQGVKKCNIFNKYLDKIPTINQIENIIGYKLNDDEIKNMQLVDGQSEIADSFEPAWEIKLSNNHIYYKSFKTNALYVSESKLNKKSVDFDNNFLLESQSGRYSFLNKTVNDEILLLKEIWKER
jgi:hypothetical protein